MTASSDCRNEANVQLQTTGRGAPGCFQVTILREARDALQCSVAFNLFSGGGGGRAYVEVKQRFVGVTPFFYFMGPRD